MSGTGISRTGTPTPGPRRTRPTAGRLIRAALWLVAGASLALPGHHLIATEIAILALFALSLDLILGFAGILSLGHGAFFGVGAYTAGLVSTRWTAEPLTGLALAAGAAGLLGLVTGPLLVRRATDLSRLMVTLAVAMLVHEAANRAGGLTGGADGLQGILTAPLLGRFEFDLAGRTGHAYALAMLAAGVLVATRVTGSGFGLALRAIRDNPLRAAAVGVPVGRHLVAVYALSAAMAGVAGALMAQTTMFVSFDAVALHRSAEVLIVLVLGGTGWVYGGLLGALVYRLAQDGLATLSPAYWQFWMGLLLIAAVLIGRERIAAVLRGARP